MDRAEHLSWAKQRALECVDRGQMEEAMASMLSDLAKHEGTEQSVFMGSLICPVNFKRCTAEMVRSWIEGFN